MRIERLQLNAWSSSVRLGGSLTIHCASALTPVSSMRGSKRSELLTEASRWKRAAVSHRAVKERDGCVYLDGSSWPNAVPIRFIPGRAFALAEIRYAATNSSPLLVRICVLRPSAHGRRGGKLARRVIHPSSSHSASLHRTVAGLVHPASHGRSAGFLQDQPFVAALPQLGSCSVRPSASAPRDRRRSGNWTLAGADWLGHSTLHCAGTETRRHCLRCCPRGFTQDEYAGGGGSLMSVCR